MVIMNNILMQALYVSFIIDYICTIYLRIHFLVGNTIEYEVEHLEDDKKQFAFILGFFVLYPAFYEFVQICDEGFAYFSDFNNLFDVTHVAMAYTHIGLLMTYGELEWETRLTLVVVIWMVTL